MKKVMLTLLVLSVLTTAGCLYDAPLAERQGLPLDPSLFGTWHEVASQNNSARIVISEYSKTEYLVLWFNGDAVKVILGYPIKVANISCLQLRMTGEKDTQAAGAIKYLVISYELSGNDLSIKSLNRDIVSPQLTSSDALRQAFLQNRDDKNLFSGVGRFERVNLSIGNQPNSEDELRMAAQKGDLATVRSLLAKGVNVNAQDNKGMTALMFAAGNVHLSIIQALLAKGANINAKDKEGSTALIYAYDNAPILQTLIAKGANVNAKNNEGATALILALSDKDIASVQVLLAKGANVNEKDKSGYTPLILASSSGDMAVVQALLASGAEINATANDGSTALIHAAIGGYTDIVRILLAKGANVNAISNNGHSALDWAIHESHTDVVAILNDAINKPCPRDLSTEYLFRLNDYVQTGVIIKRGDRLTFSASGTVNFGIMAGSGGPEGINGFRGYNLVEGDIQHGALVCVINREEGWYVVGRGTTIIADVDGTLELAVNDRDSSNNSGQFEVKVSICKAR